MPSAPATAPFGNPLAQRSNFFRIQCSPMIGRRHPFVVAGGDSLQQERMFGITRHYRYVARFGFGGDCSPPNERQPRSLLDAAVAGDAVLIENRANLRAELDFCRRFGSIAARRKRKNATTTNNPPAIRGKRNIGDSRGAN